jgi:hypothetical protein
VLDYFSDSSQNGYTIPVLDTERGGYDNVISFTALQSKDTTSVTFERPLVTNDTKNDWPIEDGEMQYAH